MDALTPNQQQLFDKVKSKSKACARRMILHARIRKGQRRKLLAAVRKLEKAPIVIDIDLRKLYRDETILDSLLMVGRFLNVIEIGDFRRGFFDPYFRTRLLNEFKIYGATCDIQPILSNMPDSERPIYASLDYLSPVPLVYYGNCRFVLKHDLRLRSTFSPFDSFETELDQFYVWDDIEGVLAMRVGGRCWFEYVLKGTKPSRGVHYIEAQVLGGVRLSDVERVHYPAADRLDREYFAKLDRLRTEHDIELVHD